MYDFDRVSERRSTYASKWDVGENELPLSIADMDFATLPEVTEALQQRLDKGMFGYTNVPDAWAQAYVDWWKSLHDFSMEKDWLFFATGVVPALSAAVRKLTTPNENVVVMTPVYNIFFNCIVNNGRRPLEVPLLLRGDRYDIDWDGLEKALSDMQTSLMILCNPHNPVGRIWSREELARVGEMCSRYHVTVVSDEIHCDLTDPGYAYVPFSSVSDCCADNSVTCLAPTKTFSLPGLQTAAVMSRNPYLRHRMWREVNTSECGEPNAFAVDAVLAAYGRGAAWLDEMRAYVFANKERVRTFVRDEVPGVRVMPGHATYLLWLDCRETAQDTAALAACIRRETGLILTPGGVYGKGGEGFLRMNTAYPRSQIDDGLNRLRAGMAAWNRLKK